VSLFIGLILHGFFISQFSSDASLMSPVVLLMEGVRNEKKIEWDKSFSKEDFWNTANGATCQRTNSNKVASHRKKFHHQNFFLEYVAG
jgi:hypothetical protein